MQIHPVFFEVTASVVFERRNFKKKTQLEQKEKRDRIGLAKKGMPIFEKEASISRTSAYGGTPERESGDRKQNTKTKKTSGFQP